MDILTENVIEWITNDAVAKVTFSQRKYINKIRKLAERDSNVIILDENQDGSIYAQVPLSYIKVSPKKKVEISDERREQMIAALQKAREKQNE